MFTTTTVFGTPIEVTLSKLVLGRVYPADEVTADIRRSSPQLPGRRESIDMWSSNWQEESNIEGDGPEETALLANGGRGRLHGGVEWCPAIESVHLAWASVALSLCSFSSSTK